MAETLSSLADLKTSAARLGRARGQPVHVQKLDKYGRAYATGKRKNAVARVWIKPGKGLATVNGKPLDVYFARPVLRMILSQPLVVANRITSYDVTVTVAGGGLSGQAGAVRHGIAKALTYYEPDLRPRSRRKASSPAIRAWSSARSTATPRPAAASSSRSAKRRTFVGSAEERLRPLFLLQGRLDELATPCVLDAARASGVGGVISLSGGTRRAPARTGKPRQRRQGMGWRVERLPSRANLVAPMQMRRPGSFGIAAATPCSIELRSLDRLRAEKILLVRHERKRFLCLFRSVCAFP